MADQTNHTIAARLDEVATMLAAQGANPYRVRAYRRAAETVRGLERPVAGLLASGGVEALEALPAIGEGIARAIRDLLHHGRMPMLERLRGGGDPVELLASVTGIGKRTADRLHHELGIDSLQELERAAHDGRLARLGGFGPKRLAGVRDSLAQRLARVRTPLAKPAADDPPVSELLDVDRTYREAAAAGRLRTIAPRRLNPTGEAWLPVLHTEIGERHYTALYSNTARAHELGTVRDWVVIYRDDHGGRGQWTVVTARPGRLAGRRVVRGREAECEAHYADSARAGAGAGRKRRA
jgi:DNA polymerase (family 10)